MNEDEIDETKLLDDLLRKLNKSPFEISPSRSKAKGRVNLNTSTAHRRPKWQLNWQLQPSPLLRLPTMHPVTTTILRPALVRIRCWESELGWYNRHHTNPLQPYPKGFELRDNIRKVS